MESKNSLANNQSPFDKLIEQINQNNNLKATNLLSENSSLLKSIVLRALKNETNNVNNYLIALTVFQQLGLAACVLLAQQIDEIRADLGQPPSFSARGAKLIASLLHAYINKYGSLFDYQFVDTHECMQFYRKLQDFTVHTLNLSPFTDDPLYLFDTEFSDVYHNMIWRRYMIETNASKKYPDARAQRAQRNRFLCVQVADLAAQAQNAIDKARDKRFFAESTIRLLEDVQGVFAREVQKFAPDLPGRPTSPLTPQRAIVHNLNGQIREVARKRDVQAAPPAVSGAQTVVSPYAGAFELNSVLSAFEDETLEFKLYQWPWSSGGANNVTVFRLRKAICSFLNAAGGVLLIGVHDATREVRGIPLTPKTWDEVWNNLSSCVYENFHPKITLSKHVRIKTDLIPLYTTTDGGATKHWVNDRAVVRIVIPQGEPDRVYTFSVKQKRAVQNATGTDNKAQTGGVSEKIYTHHCYIKIDNHTKELDETEARDLTYERAKDPQQRVEIVKVTPPDESGILSFQNQKGKNTLQVGGGGAPAPVVPLAPKVLTANAVGAPSSGQSLQNLIFVTSVPSTFTEKKLNDIFSESFGPVKGVYVVPNPNNANNPKNPNNYKKALIAFESAASRDKALRFQQIFVKSQRLQINQFDMQQGRGVLDRFAQLLAQQQQLQQQQDPQDQFDDILPNNFYDQSKQKYQPKSLVDNMVKTFNHSKKANNQAAPTQANAATDTAENNDLQFVAFVRNVPSAYTEPALAVLLKNNQLWVKDVIILQPTSPANSNSTKCAIVAFANFQNLQKVIQQKIAIPNSPSMVFNVFNKQQSPNLYNQLIAHYKNRLQYLNNLKKQQ